MRRLLPFLALLPLAASAASPPTFPDLSTPPTGLAKDATGDVALILAVESYTALPHVDGAAANARAWQAYFKARGVGTVKLMLDGDVTKEAVLGDPTAGLTGAAQQVLAQRKGNGRVWVVFIGHGAPGDGAGALVGWDAQRSAGSITARSISQDALLAALGRDSGVPIVAVVDACFSGRTSSGELAPGVQPVRPVEADQAVTGNTTVLVAAGEKEYAGSMPGLGRPAFSWLALGALRGWADGGDGTAADGTVTAKEVVEWAGGRLVETVNDRTQTPDVFGDPSLVLGRGREDAPDLSLAVERAPAAPVAAPATVTSSTSYSDLNLDVSAQLREQGCAEEAKSAATAARSKKLDAEVTRLKGEATAAWSKLEPQATACLKVTDASTRETCAKALDTYASRSTGLTASLSAGTESASTSCGARSVAFAAESRSVSVSEVSVARNLAAKLRAPATGTAGKDWTSPTVGLMKWIPSGTFTMGSPSSESGRGSDEVQHSVTLSRGFLLMEHEVTQGEWQAVVGVNPVATSQQYWSGKDQGPCSSAGVGSELPVACVSWLDAVGYANAVSKREGLTPAYTISGESVTVNTSATGYRLPTEAEWEWAARGGQATTYAGSNEVTSVGWVSSNSSGKLHPACGKVRNGYGLCDLTGNVWEWAWDWYGDYETGTVRDPTGPSTGSGRVDRGGGWLNTPERARVANRLGNDPSNRRAYLGLRLARSVP